MSAVLQWLLASMLLVMTATIFAQVIFRYILAAPLVWSEELALFMMVWITFLGSALLLERREHISIDIFVDSMPATLQSITRLFGALVIFAFNIALVYGAVVVIDVVKNSVTPGMRISVGWLYGGVFAGGVLLILVSIDQVVQAVREIMHGRPAA